jgi:hypothetical protein
VEFFKKILGWAGHPILRPVFLVKAWSLSKKSYDGPVIRYRDHFLRKAWSFLRIFRWAGHLILKPFLRKAWSLLRSLRSAGHPILTPFFLEKMWSFSKKS